jgi:hypothetical protein
MKLRSKKSSVTARQAEVDEDIGTARLVARVRKEIAAGAPLIPKAVVDHRQR